MNKISIVSALLFSTAVSFCNQALAAVPSIESKGIAAVTSCPTTLTQGTAYYSDKIVFVITGYLYAALSTDQQALNALPRNIELDIKVRDTTTSIADIKSKVLTFIGASIAANVIATNRNSIAIKSVEYTGIVCPKAP